MAFVEVDRWIVERDRSALWALKRSSGFDFGTALSSVARFAGDRRAGALIGTILVHLLLAVFLVLRVFGAGELTSRVSSSNGITLLDLSASAPTTAVVDNKTADSNTPVLPPISKNNSELPAVATVAEWRVVKLKVAVASPAPISQPAVSNMNATNAMNTAMSSGYDPYAGAAPQRAGDLVAFSRGNAAALPPAPSRAQPNLALDDRKFEMIRAAVALAWPESKGSVVFDTCVSPDGRVLSARAVEQSLEPRMVAELGSKLIGQRLFTGSTGQLASCGRRLPDFAFGAPDVRKNR